MKNLFRILIVLCFFFAAPVRADDNGQLITLAGRPVVYWAPSQGGTEKQPLLLFSHGFLGCATQSKFLMQAFADAGYWVFAPNHSDSACGGGNARVSMRTQENFVRPDLWNDSSYADRRDDMLAILEVLRTHPSFAGRIDFDRLGLVGHSLGGYTVLGLAGAWQSWRVPGVKAVLALSPYSAPYNVRNSMGGLSAPVMFQGGSRDYLITPYVSRQGGSYDTSPTPKYFVEYNGAGHMAWTSRQTGYHDAIIRSSLAFLDHYVKGTPATAELVTPDASVMRLRYASELGSR